MSTYNINSLKTQVHQHLMITLGMLIYAVAWNFFLFPHNIAGGGVTGIATIIMYATRGALPNELVNLFNSLGMESVGGGVPVTITYLVVNVFLMLLALKFVGKDFMIKSIFGICMATVALWIPFRDVYQNMTGEPFPTFDPFMSAIFAGLLSGLGLGIAFSYGGSSGGTDVIAKIMNKYWNWTLGRSLLFCDIIIISSAIFLPDSGLEKVVYGLVVMLVCTTTVDMYINGMRQSVQFFIFSQKYDEIAEAITVQVHRGVTILNGEGWYSKQPVKVLTVMARKNESNQIFRLIKSIDPDAFISQSAAIGVYGRGFDPIGKK